jgi:hypothetical protein
MQPGILMGSNEDIPAYRWWDRSLGKMVMSGDPRDTKTIEARLTSGQGLLSNGGASRGNMYSGDAAESLFTFSTLLDRERGRGPGFYLYLFSPFILFRLLTRYVIEVVKELFQQGQQKRRKDQYIVSSRNFPYAFFRGLMGPILQDLTTYSVLTDIMRGVPAIYALYPGYDDVAHFAGMQTPDALEMLTETDHYFARIERALAYAPRPYHLIVLSDHGQSRGPTFDAAYGMSLEDLVKGLVKGDEKVFAAADTNEAWDNVNALLSESVNANTRTAGVLRRMLQSKMRDGVVAVGPERDAKEATAEEEQVKAAEVVVFASGCTGLINFKSAQTRMTYEQIQDAYPDLVLGLTMHPGIGFVLVKSESNGTMVLSKAGVNYIDVGSVEGHDPLAAYSPNAAELLRRESSFPACPDIIVNTLYDPETQELCGFENQASHHGGLGGPQNFAFILYPASLSYDGAPVVGATSVYKLLHRWRKDVQGAPELQLETVSADQQAET